MNPSIEGEMTVSAEPHETHHGFSYTAHLVLERADSSEILARAAQLAYYLMFALFPTLIFIAILLSIEPMPDIFETLLDYLQRVLPPQTFAILKSTIEHSAGNHPKGLVSLSIIVVIWAASSGMEAMISALNAAYEVKSSRGILKERLMAILLTFALGILTAITLTIAFFGESIGNFLSIHYGFGRTFERIWTVLRWPLASLFLLMMLDLLYFFGPNIRQKWRWITPGAVVAVGLWFLISITIRFWVSTISDYSAIYGALGAVMVLMMWLYFTSLAILLGGVINATLNKLHHASAHSHEDSD